MTETDNWCFANDSVPQNGESDTTKQPWEVTHTLILQCKRIRFAGNIQRQLCLLLV